MKTPLNDELQVTLSVKWMFQLIFFIFGISGAWYTLNGSIDSNKKQIDFIKQTLVKYEQMVDERVGRLESYKEQELEAVNKSMLSRVLGKE